MSSARVIENKYAAGVGIDPVVPGNSINQEPVADKGMQGGGLRVAKLAAAIAMIGISSAVQAQRVALEEVVITAQKRSESLQDVPVSVAALSAGELEGFKLRDAQDIAAQIPNLQNTNPLGSGFPIFSLRGISMNDYSLNHGSPVASYVDEVYKGNPAIQGVEIYDLERIEVLRGPQGTLYGRNSTGGAVNFITRSPSFEREGFLSAGVGNYNRKELEGAFDTPLIDDVLALRVAGTWTEQDGWYENVNHGIDDGYGIDEYGLRASLSWTPTDRLEAILRVSTGQQRGVGPGTQAFHIGAGGVGAGLYGLYNLLGATSATDSYREGLDYFEYDSSERDNEQDIENDAVALTVNWDIGQNHTLTSITSWDRGEIFVPDDSDGSANEVLSNPQFGRAKQIAQDLRITSNHGGAFEYIAGLYYSREEVSNRYEIGYWTDLDMNIDGNIDFYDCLDVLSVSEGLGAATPAGAATEETLNAFGLSLGDFLPAACQNQNDFDQEHTSRAVYVDTSYAFSDAWTVRLGLRYTKDEIKLENYSARLLGSDDTPLINTVPGNAVDPYASTPSQEISTNEVTGKVGIDYTFESGNMVYASYSHGYRNGGFNAQAFFSPVELTTVEPEKLDAFEAGFKSRLLEGAMELNGSLFYYTYENQQFQDVDPSSLANRLVNIDESEITGAELEMRYRPIESVMLRTGLGWLDTEVKEGVLNGQDVAGNELLLSPTWNVNLGLDWDVMSTSLGTVVLRLESSWVDAQYFDVFNVERLKQGAYWLHNARLQFDDADEQWSTGVWVRNLADEEYRTYVLDLQDFGYDFSRIGAPRSFGVDVTFNF